jgi:hypothetical protein
MRVPTWWLDDFPADVKPLMEEFLLGLASLPEEIASKVDEVVSAPDQGDPEILQILWAHYQEHGGDTRALTAVVKMVAMAIEEAEAEPEPPTEPEKDE